MTDVLKPNVIRLYSDSLVPQYMLIEPGTTEETLLKSKWRWFAEQHNLCIVSWTFIPACILAQTILPIRGFKDVVPIFSRMAEEMGEPLRVFLHKSLEKCEVHDLPLKIVVCVFCLLSPSHSLPTTLTESLMDAVNSYI
jgi:hypothetical protein